MDQPGTRRVRAATGMVQPLARLHRNLERQWTKVGLPHNAASFRLAAFGRSRPAADASREVGERRLLDA